MSLAIAYGMRKRGEYQSQCTEHCVSPCEVHPQANIHPEEPSSAEKRQGEHSSLNQLGNRSEGAGDSNSVPSRVRKIMMSREQGYSKGGDVSADDSKKLLSQPSVAKPAAQEEKSGAFKMGEGLAQGVNKIAKSFSEGGRVANSDHGVDDSRLAGFSPNEFDDLSLRDDLEFSYTGANSGDEISDEQEDKDRRDIVSRIMRSRSKKDRMPSPA